MTATPPPTEDASEHDEIGTFYAFRFFNYRMLWIGDLATAGAQWMQQVTVSWMVQILTGSSGLVGSVNLMRAFATLLSPAAGLATDRLGRNRVIAWSQVAMLAVTVAIGVDVSLGTVQLSHIFVFMLLVSVAQTFNMPARQTFVFDLVPRRVIPNAVALSWLAFSIARAGGTMIGGSLVKFVGPATNFYLQAIAYGTVLASVLLIRTGPRPPAPPRKAFLGALMEGWTFALSDPQVRLLLIMSAISPALIIPLHAALLPAFAQHVFNGDAGTFGLLAGSIGVGGLLGGLLTASLNRIDRRGLMQLIALLIFAFSETAFSVLAAVTHNLWLCVPFLVIAGTFETVYTTTNTSVMQLLAPEHLRGSIASVLQLTFLIMPVGSLVAGVAADRVGAPLVGAIITAAAGTIGIAILVLSSRMRGLRLSNLVRDSQDRSAAIGAAH